MSTTELRTIFFFNDTTTTEIYTLSLHDALPIWVRTTRGKSTSFSGWSLAPARSGCWKWKSSARARSRSEEHTSELQSRQYLVCRLLLEKKKEQSLKHHVHSPSLLILIFITIMIP